MNNFRNKVREMVNLPKNWDTHGADPPNAISIENTLKFLDILESKSLLPDWVEATSNGSILLEVKDGEILQEWDFYTDGEIAVLYEKNGKTLDCKIVKNLEEALNYV